MKHVFAVTIFLFVSLAPIHGCAKSRCSKELPDFARKAWKIRHSGISEKQALVRDRKSEALNPPLHDRQYILKFMYELSPDVTSKEFVMYWIGFCDGKADATSNKSSAPKRTPTSTSIWTESEIHALKGKSVTDLIKILGKPWYQGQGFTGHPFLKWAIKFRSKLTGEVMTGDITVVFGRKHEAIAVSIDDGIVSR